MAEHGATLQTYNQELVKALEDLKAKRKEIAKVVLQEEAAKKELERDLAKIENKLQAVNYRLAEHKRTHDNYDIMIRDAENGFKKILESSQTLLSLVQNGSSKLNNKSNELCTNNSY